jgi:hypothetical protein
MDGFLCSTGMAVMLLRRCLVVFSLILVAGCHPPSQSAMKSDPLRRDVNAVLRDHDDELLAIPGVVGVYVGLLTDGKTPCLKVMVARRTPELKQRIPKLLEGYTVVVEETGVIRPLEDK